MLHVGAPRCHCDFFLGLFLKRFQRASSAACRARLGACTTIRASATIARHRPTLVVVFTLKSRALERRRFSSGAYCCADGDSKDADAVFSQTKSEKVSATAACWARLSARAAVQTCTTVVRPHPTSEAVVSHWKGALRSRHCSHVRHGRTSVSERREREGQICGFYFCTFSHRFSVVGFPS